MCWLSRSTMRVSLQKQQRIVMFCEKYSLIPGIGVLRTCVQRGRISLASGYLCVSGKADRENAAATYFEFHPGAMTSRRWENDAKVSECQSTMRHPAAITIFMWLLVALSQELTNGNDLRDSTRRMQMWVAAWQPSDAGSVHFPVRNWPPTASY